MRMYPGNQEKSPTNGRAFFLVAVWLDPETFLVSWFGLWFAAMTEDQKSNVFSE